MTVDSTPNPTTLSENKPEEKQAPQPPADGVVHYTDGYSYEVPRPFLTLQQASAILGKSLRSIERSLLGRWGNKLPDGWLARKLRTENGDEWRILPPPGFRVKLATSAPADEDDTEYDTEQFSEKFDQAMNNNNNEPSSASKRQVRRHERHSLEQPTIVIDRSEEVEHLLRDLVAAQRALAEERRMHLEDLRMISQLQSSMRLLEVNAAEQNKAKSELETAKQELIELREKYNRELNTPWWRKMFQSQQTT